MSLKKISSILLTMAVLCGVLLTGCVSDGLPRTTAGVSLNGAAQSGLFSIDDIPAFVGDSPWVEVNGNTPFFDEADINTELFETFADLDSLGRCGVVYANVCKDLMPTDERGDIGQVKPTGWHTVKYDNVDGKYLYNRCHLLGFQLTGENANEENLITGTRFLNIQGMLPFENMVADYVKETDNHVLYRVTPIFQGSELIARGVLLEGYSVEDNGDGISFCVFAYNAQPGVAIDYGTGDSWADESVGTGVEAGETKAEETAAPEELYIMNTSSHKFHLPSCSSVAKMSDNNKEGFMGSREDLIAQGYVACGACNP